MSKIWRWSLIAAFSGFLFGFDTVVISGADKTLQLLWSSSDVFHGLVVMGMALWGTLMGALLGGIPTNRFGRKNTLIGIGILFTLSALGSSFANDAVTFSFFRFIGGLGVGASTIAAPAYISEIAPAKNRGRLVGLYQFNIVLGILIAFFSNYMLSQIGANAWRWMVGIEAIPAFIFILLVFGIPKSPRWLSLRSDYMEAIEVLRLANPDENIEQWIIDLEKEKDRIGIEENIFMKKYRFPLILAFLIAFFNQFSGINAFLYYAPRILEEAGMGQSAALYGSMGIGIANLIFTLLGIHLIDRIGRKQLMYIGSIGYIFSLSLVSAAFFNHWDGTTVAIFLFVFIGAHAVGQGSVIWVFISEIFPNHLRGSGQAFGSSVHWILAAVIPSFIPLLFANLGAGPVFGFFAFMMLLQLCFVRFLMPETKGISLENSNIRPTKKPRIGLHIDSHL